jgi:signal transduction histidine kinase
MTPDDVFESNSESPPDSGVSSANQLQGDTQDKADRALHEFLALTAYTMLGSATASWGYSQLLRRHLDRVIAQSSEDTEVRHALDRCLAMLDQLTRSNETLIRLNRNLSEVIRGYEDGWCTHMRACDLREIVGQAIEQARLMHPECRMQMATLPDMLVPVMADEWRVAGLLGDVLVELSMYGGAIAVHIEKENRKARVWVHKERARYLRDTLHRQLYMAQAIMKSQQGEVGIHSMGDEGDIFWLTLPLAPDA